MKTLIKQLFTKWGCMHDWKLYHSADLYENNSKPRPYASRHTLICKKCGKIKKINL